MRKVVAQWPRYGYDLLKSFGSLNYAVIVANHNRFASPEFLATLIEDVPNPRVRAAGEAAVLILEGLTVAELGELPCLDKVSIPFVSMNEGITKMVAKDSTPVAFSVSCFDAKLRWRFWSHALIYPFGIFTVGKFAVTPSNLQRMCHRLLRKPVTVMTAVTPSNLQRMCHRLRRKPVTAVTPPTLQRKCHHL